MAKKLDETGLYQLKNGNWAFRYGVVVNGKTVWRRVSKDENGIPFKTKRQAVNARQATLEKEKTGIPQPKKLQRKTVLDVWEEYCRTGRSGKAYATILKQESLWKNHIKDKFGDRFVDEISVAEVNDYLEQLYYLEDRAYSYVESFLKMFYLIFGQAYSRDYLAAGDYDKLCQNKATKIRMPKMKIDEETDIIIFSDSELKALDDYFKGTNVETAYMIGRYCGLRINETFGLKWTDIDFEEGCIIVNQQMQYQGGLIKLVPLKTRNAKRKVYMCDKLRVYLLDQYTQYQNNYVELAKHRHQNQTIIEDVDGEMISSLVMVNTLPNGKIQTVNSMKYHAKKIEAKLGIHFKYHYLRHTYGTMLANNNVPSHILRNQMGHGNINVTMKYYVGTSDTAIDVLKNKINML